MQRPPLKTGRVLLCLEILQDSHPEGSVQLVASIPGRQGTLTHSWRCPGGIPTDGQFQDLQGRLGSLAVDAILLQGSGIQQQLAL